MLHVNKLVKKNNNGGKNTKILFSNHHLEYLHPPQKQAETVTCSSLSHNNLFICSKGKIPVTSPQQILNQHHDLRGVSRLHSILQRVIS